MFVRDRKKKRRERNVIEERKEMCLRERERKSEKDGWSFFLHRSIKL